MQYSFRCFAEFAAMRAVIRQILLDLSPRHAPLLFIALNEAVNNAYQHGCADGSDQIVEVKLEATAEEICLQVSHNGVGIRTADIGRAMPADMLDDHGRGLTIIRFCTDSIQYDDSGRVLVMRKSLQPSGLLDEAN